MLLGIRWGSLRTKIIAWSFVPTAIILFVVALVAYLAYVRTTQDLVLEKNQELARLSAAQLGAELPQYAAGLAALGRSPDILSEDPALRAAAFVRESGRLAVFDAGVVILNGRGRVLSAWPERPEIAGQVWSGRAYFRQLQRVPVALFSDVVDDGPGNSPVVLVAVPFLGAHAELQGIGLGMFGVGASTVSAFYGSIIKQRLGGADIAYLVDSRGRVIYHPDAVHVGTDFLAQPAARQAAAGATSAMRTRDVNGRDVVASFAPVPSTSWGLVVESGWSTVLGASQSYRGFLTLLLILGLLVPAAVVAVGVRRITRPISDLIEAAQDVGSGRFPQIRGPGTGDEVEELVRQFNRMSRQLEESYAALREREERFRLAVDGANDGIWDWDLRSDECYYSPRWKSMLGYADDEVPNTFAGWFNLIHPDDQARALAQARDEQAGRTAVYQLEHRLRCKDGSYKWVLARGATLRDEQNVPCRMAGSHTDITERVRAEAQIRTQNAYLAALHETGLAVVGRLDLDELLRAVVERGLSLVEAAYGWVYLVRAGALEATFGTGLFQKHVGVRLARGEGLAGSIWETGQALAVAAYSAWPRASSAFAEDMIGPAMGAPLTSGGEVAGVIGLTRAPGALPFTPDEVALIARFAQLASIALDNARLHTSLQAELAERVRAEVSLEERLGFEKIIASISSEFVNLQPAGIEDAIQRALERIGRFCGADRSYVFLLSDDRLQLINTHEWCVDPARSQGARERSRSIADFPWRTAKLLRMENVHVARVADLPPEAAAERAEFEQQRIQSSLNVPMTYQGEARGYLGLDAVARPMQWSDDTIALMRIVGEVLINALEHKRAQEALQAAYATLERRVDERTHELGTLNAVAAVVSRSLDLQEIMGDALEQTMQATGMEHGLAYRLDGSGEERRLVALAQRNVPDEVLAALSPLSYGAIFAEQSARMGQPFVTPLSYYPAALRRAAGERADLGQRVTVTVPLMARNKVAGALLLSTSAERRLTPEELSLLRGIGQQVGMAIENAGLYQDALDRQAEADRRRAVAEGLRGILATLNSNQSLPEILNYIIARATHLLGAQAGLVVRVDAEGKTAAREAGWGLPPDVDAYPLPGVEPTGGNLAILSRRATTIGDLPAYVVEQKARLGKLLSAEYAGWYEVLCRHYGAIFAAPLIAKDRVYGNLSFFYALRREFSDEDLSTGMAIADQAALAIENAWLRAEAQQAALVTERNRLARELHDSVTQSLYSVTLYAEAAARLLSADQTQQAAEHMRSLRDTAQEALREMRLLIFELRPPELEKSTLAAALRARLKAVEGRGGVESELRAEGVERLTLAERRELYQVAQEALNNVLRHAHAQHVAVKLSFGAQATLLEVCDDGTGFDLKATEEAGGQGLVSLRERAQRLGATLDVQSQPGCGTVVRLVMAAGREDKDGA